MEAITTPPSETEQEPPVIPKPVVEEAKQTEAQVKILERTEEEKSSLIKPESRPHAFVIMPFGKKKGGDGSPYDFNAIYETLIKPSLEMAGFEAFRADEEATSGDILTDMFQELLLADLCIADMSIDNANVFYELGIRHAFRKRGVVHIQAGRSYMPFDVFNVRTIPYHITAEGVPDPRFLEKDKAVIIRGCRATWASEPERVHSPIYNLLTGLVEPERKTLRTPLATGFWREYNDWKQRVTVAQLQKRIGDILLLTEEIKNPLIKEEAISTAGKALANMGRNELALSQYRKGLEVNPRNLTFRREEAFHLNRLGFVDDAIVKIENLLTDVPDDFDAVAYLGRIYKEMWVKPWKGIKEKGSRIKAAFESYHWLIKSFETYLKAYRLDLDQMYPGVNALTLGTVLIHLADKYDNKKEPDPEITWVRGILPELRGSLTFALESKALDDMADYWTLVSLAELCVLAADVPQQVTRAYRKALTASRRNQFFLQSSLDQLEMLHSLDIREEFVHAGITTLTEEMGRIQNDTVGEGLKPRKGKVEKAEKPRKGNDFIFLFTGYMINNPKKREDHFPPEKEGDIRAAINAVLDRHNAGANDLAVSTGMDAGSELLFVESCVERGIPVQVYFPMPEAPYVRDFVSPGGKTWIQRFYEMRNHPLVSEYYQPDNVGEPKEGDNVHERNNRWALYSSMARSIDKMRLIAVWDGKSEAPKDLDARLVQHMVELVRESGGIVEQIDPSKTSETVVEVTTVTSNAHSSISIRMNSASKANESKPKPQKKKVSPKTKG